MWNVSNTALTMVEGDFGLALPFTVDGITPGEGDALQFVFKDEKNGRTLLTKTYDDISSGVVPLMFSESESELFPVGRYVYSLDWYHDGRFMCNLITSATLKVVDKA